jgi:hypothetical protein
MAKDQNEESGEYDSVQDNPLNKLMPKGAAKGYGGSKSFLAKLMECQQSLAILHWKTTSYAEHKALGEAYEGLADKIDGFIESFIGVKGREILNSVTTLSIMNDVKSVLMAVENVLRKDIPSAVGDKETALLNLRDEMLDLVQHTRYLLTLS